MAADIVLQPEIPSAGTRWRADEADLETPVASRVRLAPQRGSKREAGLAGEELDFREYAGATLWHRVHMLDLHHLLRDR